ncbi:MAG: hypothetical protein ACYCPW_03785 [Nitrososphaerales archaeon]
MQSAQEIDKDKIYSVSALEFEIRNQRKIKDDEHTKKVFAWLKRGIELDVISPKDAEETLAEEDLYA